MTEPGSPRPGADAPGDHSAEATRRGWAQRKRERIAAEIARNRRGEYTVPTWVLALALALIVGGWLALVLLS